MKNHEHTQTLGEHYARLLDLSDPWLVTDTILDIKEQTLDIRIAVKETSTLPVSRLRKSIALVRSSRRTTVAPSRHDAIQDDDHFAYSSHLMQKRRSENSLHSLGGHSISLHETF